MGNLDSMGVIKMDKTKIVYIGNTNCVYCSIMKPIIEKIEQTFLIEVEYLDSEHSATKQKYAFNGVPSVGIWKNNNIQKNILGIPEANSNEEIELIMFYEVVKVLLDKEE